MHKTLKKICVLLFFETIVFICNGQNQIIKGTWYLHEVQIPSMEEYSEGIQYDKYRFLSFKNENNKETSQEWVDSEDFEEVIAKADEETEEPKIESQDVLQDNENAEEIPIDTSKWDILIRELRELTDVSDDNVFIGGNYQGSFLYEIFNDSVLVLNPQFGVYDVYVIKRLSNDLLVLATDRTFQGYTIFVYGRTEQTIKYTKHNVNMEKDRYPNPIVNRLGAKEISANKTPAAVAYNFINAILDSNTERMLSYMDDAVANDFEKNRMMNGYSNYDPFFSEDGSKLNILGWKPYLSNGEVAVLYVQSEWFDEKGREIKKVYVGCVPSEEVDRVGFQDITKYGDTDVKVLVAKENDSWKVVGFK